MKRKVLRIMAGLIAETRITITLANSDHAAADVRVLDDSEKTSYRTRTRSIISSKPANISEKHNHTCAWRCKLPLRTVTPVQETRIFRWQHK